MFLEAQFGADNISPIALPKLAGKEPLAPELSSTMKDDGAADGEGSKDEDDELEALQKQEIERLHQIGIPVPGVEIKVDKMVAKVWLEDLDVECANRVFGDRVRAVVERAVEVSAPLWA
jgi:cleavage and polyadenylation specificity factor subunit 3